ncbi:MAG: hypothetical protein ACOYXT_23000 [Bacteroidota bacterium]
MTKCVKILLPLLLFTAVLAKAQTSTTAAAQPAISDDDLKKYAVTMDSIKGMQTTLQGIIAKMVQESKAISVQRFNELNKIADNEAKLAEAKATPEEIGFLKEVAAKRKEETARINSTYQGLAKDFVGLKVFNVIKKKLETDTELKAKYDTMLKDLSSKQG